MKKSHLTKHFHIHTDEQKIITKQPKTEAKGYKCDICENMFAEKINTDETYSSSH